MTERQAKFFRALCAPFEDWQVKTRSGGGKTLHYITARTLFNRLDEVCEPHGWTIDYRPTERGFVCRLALRVPTDQVEDGAWTWVAKEDGGGFAGMTETRGGTQQEDGENDEKSGYSSAAKRAGAAWGIGRYLYKDGVPSWLRDLYDGPAPSAPQERPQQAQRERPEPAPRETPRQAEPQRQGGYDNFQVPRSARALYPWAKNLEKHYGVTGVVQLLDAIGKEQGMPRRYTEWADSDATAIAWTAIGQIREWECYGNEFEAIWNKAEAGPDLGSAPTQAESLQARKNAEAAQRRERAAQDASADDIPF